MSFKDLGLGPNILRAIEECGYTTPTPIQEQAIPQILMTRDIVGLAQTGTGKTAGFILPMIEILHDGRAKARMPRSLVLSPTRELAAQIAENFDEYGKYSKLSKALLTGGVSIAEQIKLLDRGVDVLIATPGRLLDLFERGNILLNDIKVLVIDEADRMLDMGFIPDIEKIVSRVPPIRQTLLFSATMPPEIKKLSDKFLSNPRQVSVAEVSSAAETVKQSLIWTAKNNKANVLKKILAKEDIKNAFIFCNRKRDIADLAKTLEREGYNVAALHGDMAQSDRTRTLESFKNDEITLLVCSDVAARGLDVSALSHVFNYDVPMSSEDYIHRIGRTGRAGMEGRAWTIASHKIDVKFVDAIERLLKRSIDVETLDGSKSSAPKKSPVKENAEKSSAKDDGDKPQHSSKSRRSPYGRDRNRNRTSSEEAKSSNPSRSSQSSQRNDRNEKRHSGGGRHHPEVQSEDAGDSFGNNLPDFLRKK